MTSARAEFAVQWFKTAGGGMVGGTGGVFGAGTTSGQGDAGVATNGTFGASLGFWAVQQVGQFQPLQILGLVAGPGLDDATQVSLLWNALPTPQVGGFASYEIYFTSDGSEPTTASPHFTVANASQLGVLATTNFMGTNLTYETEYRFRIAGRNGAGLMSPLSTVVTQQLGSFVATQVVVTAGSGVQVRWNARSNAVYDVIYQDATSWSDSLTNGWQLLATTTNEFPVDTGTVSRTAPHLLGGSTMRFYRVASLGSWRTNGGARVATREIYVAKPLVLMPGENWLSLFTEPGSNTVAAIFGTDRLPPGAGLSTATKISWYASANAANATNVIWLSNSGHWLYSVGGEGIANDQPLPLTQGFNIEIPGTATQRLVVLGRISTNTTTYPLAAGAPGTESYNLRAITTPRRTTIAETGLKSVLTAGINPTAADEIRVLDNSAGAGSKSSPKFRIWLRSTDNTFRYTPGTASAEAHTFDPGDLLVIVRRNPGTPTATNRPFFTAPGKNVNP